jgi:hypothetical protein
MARGVSYTDSGEGLVIPRGISGVIDSEGQGAIKTSSGGKASFTDANGAITIKYTKIELIRS